jgi:hypothetical protein
MLKYLFRNTVNLRFNGLMGGGGGGCPVMPIVR